MTGHEGKMKEFEEKSFKIFFSESFTFEIDGESIVAETGQPFTLPRKIALKLESEGKGKIEFDDELVNLKQALSKEKMVGEQELAIIDEFFYLRLNEYSSRIKGREQEFLQDKLYELFRMRNGKIIKFASTKLDKLDEIKLKLSFEEVDFLEKLSIASTELHFQIFEKNIDIKVDEIESKQTDEGEDVA